MRVLRDNVLYCACVCVFVRGCVCLKLEEARGAQDTQLVMVRCMGVDACQFLVNGPGVCFDRALARRLQKKAVVWDRQHLVRVRVMEI